jgi:hypothetical protein
LQPTLAVELAPRTRGLTSNSEVHFAKTVKI